MTKLNIIEKGNNVKKLLIIAFLLIFPVIALADLVVDITITDPNNMATGLNLFYKIDDGNDADLLAGVGFIKQPLAQPTSQIVTITPPTNDDYCVYLEILASDGSTFLSDVKCALNPPPRTVTRTTSGIQVTIDIQGK